MTRSELLFPRFRYPKYKNANSINDTQKTSERNYCDARMRDVQPSANALFRLAFRTDAQFGFAMCTIFT